MDLDSQSEEEAGGGSPSSILVDVTEDENVDPYPAKDMSADNQNSTSAPIQPLLPSVSASTHISEIVASPSPIHTDVNPVSLNADTTTTETKSPEPQLGNKTITSLVLSNTTKPVLQSVVNANSPLITVLNSSGPLTVVKSMIVTSGVSSAPRYTLVNSSAMNSKNAVGRPPTITVLNCEHFTCPVTGLKTITTQQAAEKSSLDGPTTSNLETSQDVIGNREKIVFTKNRHLDSRIPHDMQCRHKLPVATNLAFKNVLTYGRRNNVKLFSNIHAGAAQTNVQSNEPPQYSTTSHNFIQKPGKLRAPLMPIPTMFGNNHMHYIQPKKQWTFNHASTAQVIKTLGISSSSSFTPVFNKYEVCSAKYGSAFNCSVKPVLDGLKTEERQHFLSGSMRKAVMLDHNYNTTMPSQVPFRPPPPINTHAQTNGINPSSYNTSQQNKRQFFMPPTISPPAVSTSTVTISPPAVSTSTVITSRPTMSFTKDMNQHNNDDNFSDISDDEKRDTEGEETDTAPEAEDMINGDYGDYVTRCICRFVHDDGYMVECDKCKVWQHVQCVIKNFEIPDEYLCELCDPTKTVDRENAKLLQEEMIREWQLHETKMRKEAMIKKKLRQNESSDSTDSESMVRNNNVITKNRTGSASERKIENSKVMKEGKESAQRRKKVKKVIKRKLRNAKPTQLPSEDETPESQTAYWPRLRLWFGKYEEAVTNHYSPELRARILRIRANGATASNSTITYDENVHNCGLQTQPLTGIKYLVSTVQLQPNTPVIELRGKYMLFSQDHNEGGSLITRQHSQRLGPFLFVYSFQKHNTEVCVDTRTYGNVARFIRRSCRPNAEIQHCIDKGVLHLYIVTTALVEKNCELTLKHESQDFSSIVTRQIACACGSPDECKVNITSIKKNGILLPKKRRERRANGSNIRAPEIRAPLKEALQPSDGPGAALSLPLPSVLEEDKKEGKENIKIEAKVEGNSESKENMEESFDEIDQPQRKINIKEEILETPKKMRAKANGKIEAEPQKEELHEVKVEKQYRSPLPPNSLPPEKAERKKCKAKVKSKKKQEKIEAKKDKQKIEPEKGNHFAEEKVKKPHSTPVSILRISKPKSEKEEIKYPEKPQPLPQEKKLSREERKFQAILRAIEQMEKDDKKMQERQDKQARRRKSEPRTRKDQEKPDKVIRRRRRGRARTRSTNGPTKRTITSSQTFASSGDYNLLSPIEALSPMKPSKENNSDGKCYSRKWGHCSERPASV